MNSMITLIRKEKHEHANQMAILMMLAKSNPVDASQKIIQYIEDVTHQQLSSYNTYKTGNSYVDGLLSVKSNIASQHGANLIVDCEASLNDLNIKDNDLISVIGNILDNSIQAISQDICTHEKKEVRLHTYHEDAWLLIEVNNNGPMIPEGILSHLFDCGFTTKSIDVENHGYGLYIVKEIVQSYQGKITVSSSKEQTRFIIRLPMNVYHAYLAT